MCIDSKSRIFGEYILAMAVIAVEEGKNGMYVIATSDLTPISTAIVYIIKELLLSLHPITIKTRSYPENHLTLRNGSSSSSQGLGANPSSHTHHPSQVRAHDLRCSIYQLRAGKYKHHRAQAPKHLSPAVRSRPPFGDVSLAHEIVSLRCKPMY